MSPMAIDFEHLAAQVDTLRGQAERRETPCGDGHMVWHLWGEGPPLVLLHGGSGSWTHWFRNVPALARHFRLYVADMPGLGESDMPPEAFQLDDYPATMRMMAGAIADGVNDLLGASQRYHLSGFSLGSIAGTYLAAAEGDRVASLTLVGSAAFGIPWNGLTGTLTRMTESMGKAERLEAQRRNLGIIMLGDMASADDLAAYLQLRNVERARVRSHGIGDTDSLIQALVHVTAPLGGIWGRDDVYAQPNLEAIGDILRGQDPDARYTLIDGAGHWVMYERPDAFDAALIETILQRIED